MAATTSWTPLVRIARSAYRAGLPEGWRTRLRRRRRRPSHPALEIFQGNRAVDVLPMLMAGARTAVEVGAFRGDYTLLLAAHALHVHAFEPRAAVAEGLRRRVGRNVTVHAVAASDRAGSLTLWMPTLGGEPAEEPEGARSSLEPHVNPEFDRRAVDVPVRTLDSFDFADVDFLMIEVEGHELSVLRGAERTISRDQPTMLVSAQSRFRADLPAEVERHLVARGYQGFFIERGVLRPFSEFDPSRHQRPEDANWGNPHYIYVFLFVHRDRPEVIWRLATVLRIDDPALRRAAGATEG